MEIGKILKAALDGIAPVQSGAFKAGGKPVGTYIVTNYNSFPSNFGDDEPGAEIFFVQVHLFCPRGVNSHNLRERIKRAISGAGFTWPSVVDASGSDGQHFVFECQIAHGIEVE